MERLQMQMCNLRLYYPQVRQDDVSGNAAVPEATDADKDMTDDVDWDRHKVQKCRTLTWAVCESVSLAKRLSRQCHRGCQSRDSDAEARESVLLPKILYLVSKVPYRMYLSST